MNMVQKITEIAEGDHEYIGESVVVKNTDGTISVCDNGEEVRCDTAEEAARIVKENQDN
jgi:hypothetical protein